MTAPKRRAPGIDREDAQSASDGTPRLDKSRTIFTSPAATESRTHGPASAWTFAQWVFTVLGWILFLWAWISVMRYTAPATMVSTVALLVLGAVVIETVTLLWIAHNVNIYRKKGPRRNVTRVTDQLRQDFLGRELVGDWRRLLEEYLILVDANDGRKTFASYRRELREPADDKLASRLRLRVVPTSPGEEEEAP